MRHAGIVISPMGIGEVLDAGFTLAKRNYRQLLLITAWGGVPSYAALGFAGALESGTRSSLLALAAILTLLGVVGMILMAIAVVIACGRLIEPAAPAVAPNPAGLTWASAGDGRPDGLDAAEIYGRALGRLWTVLLFGLLLVVLAIPLLIVFPLAIFLFGRWAAAYAVIGLESVGPVEALRRSWRLTAGSWWHTVLTFFAGTVVTSIVTFVLALVIGGIAAIFVGLTGSSSLGAFLTMLANGVPAVVVEPFSAAIMVVLYYELRARAEGYDLAQRVSQLVPA